MGLRDWEVAGELDYANHPDAQPDTPDFQCLTCGGDGYCPECHGNVAGDCPDGAEPLRLADDLAAAALGALDPAVRARLELYDQVAQSPARGTVTLRIEDYLAVRRALAAATQARAAAEWQERIAAHLDCKTPQCPRERAVLLTGPTPEERYGVAGWFAEWWCASCRTQWGHWERVMDASEREARAAHDDRRLTRPESLTAAERAAIQAARAWARLRAIARDPKTPPDEWRQNGKALVAAEATLAVAVAALPGEQLPAS